LGPLFKPILLQPAPYFVAEQGQVYLSKRLSKPASAAATTKQIEHLNATTCPSLQLQRLGTKGMALQLELKVRSGETPRNMSLSNLLWESQAPITISPTATKQTTTCHRLKRSWVRVRAVESRREETAAFQVEAVSIPKSPDWVIVRAIAKALEACATVLHHCSQQFPDHT
jgi:hypothetical protein